MNKRPGQVRVTIETGYCSFCGRPRNLRREEHQLGTLVRSIITCETCHRTLSSSVGVASAEPAAAEEPVKAEAPVPDATPVKAKAAAKLKRAPAKKATAKPAVRGGKPTSTATRRVTKKK